MSNRIVSAIAFVALSFAAVGPALAQVAGQVPPPRPYPQQPVLQQPYPQQPGPQQPYPQQYPQQPYSQACPPRVTPSAQVLDERFMHRFGPLGLAPAQQQRIESMVAGFSQMHPAGSPLEPAAMHQLRDEVRSVLTPQQLAMLEQENRNRAPGPHPCP